MPTYSLHINYASIRAKIDKALGEDKVRRAAYKKAYDYFKRAHNTMLKQFNEHPITQEIEAGPRALNTSDTLDGYGNLFSFIGFPAEDDPIAPLREMLADNVTFRQTIYRDRKWYFRVSVPSREDIEHVTDMPWEHGNSWAYAVENDISGASHYMYKKWEAGRSGTGFQLPYENMEDLIFQPRPYISEILANFREKINNS